MDDGVRLREFLAPFVVVDDDDRKPRFLEDFDGREGRDAVIDGDYQGIEAGFDDAFGVFLVKAVPVEVAAREIEADLGPVVA